MLISTQGVILHSFTYSDRDVIVTIYTREFGRQAYMLSVSRSRRSSNKMGIIQPLFLVDLVGYHKETREIQRIKDIKNHPVYQNIPFDIIKSTQSIFIAEILSKTLREQESVPELFEFISSALLFFDLAEEGKANFHLWFLIRLTEYLGFKPNIEKGSYKCWFDMRTGVVVPYEPSHPFFMHPEATTHFCRLVSLKIDELNQITLSREIRNYLITRLIDFYQLHFEHLGEVKSLRVLQEIFS